MRRAAGLALAVALAAAGCAPDCSRAPGEARPDVVLVTIDTLRADHLGAYGSATVKTPNLDRLAADGLVFERAYAASDVTIPSHLSLLSSLPVVEHGVVDLATPVARPVTLLPEVFQAAGYRTAAFVSAVHLGPTRALGQLVAPGVSHFEVPRRESKPYRATETNDRLFPWLRGNCRAPFFVWVHYWDPHMPYTPEAPWDTAYYHDDPYAPRFDSMRDVQLVWFAYDLDHFRRHLARDAKDVRALKRDLGASSRQVKDLVLYPNLLDRYTSDAATRAALRARIREIATRIRPGVPLRRLHADWLTGVRDVHFPLAQYAGEVSSTDVQIGRLRAELARLGIADRTILVVTADHGESLGEHGLWFEHLGLHDPVAHVPLIVSAPGRVTPGRRPEPVSSLDVAPTVLGLAGLPAAPGMRGRDLVRDAAASPLVVSEAVRRDQISVVQGRWKLVRTEHSVSYTDAFERQAGTVELYDLETDPKEVHDLAAAEPGRVAELRAALDVWLDGHRAPPPPPPPGKRDTLDDLRALGYVE